MGSQESSYQSNLRILNEKQLCDRVGDSASFYPLSSGQQALWFLYQMVPESTAYNIFITVRICSNIDIRALHRTWEKIFERHPILRTTYTTKERKPVQLLQEKQDVYIQVTDASNWSEDYLKKQIFAETDRPFNLEKDLVLRVNLFRLAQEHILLLTMHHIAGDLWSFDLLLNEFQVLYAAEIEQVSQQTEIGCDSLTENKLYTEFVRWQSEMLSSSTGEKLWQYWQKQLAGELPILNLLADRPRPLVQTYRGDSHILKLDEQLIQELRNLALATGTSLYKILLAAFYVQLYRYTHQEDIPIASPMAGRWGQEEFKGIVGYFVNFVVLRISVSGSSTFKEFLAQVSNTVKEAQEHQDYPFSLLVERLQQKRDPSRSPLCQVSFTWQKQRWCQPLKNLSYRQKQGLEMKPYLLGHQRGATFDLDVMVMEALGLVQVCWQYNTDLFDASTVQRMTGHFQTLLEGIVANPEQQISQLPLLTKEEQHQLLVEWNNTQKDFPEHKCIHQLFEEQVQRTPDAIAVEEGSQQLTYKELNQKANQLAHYLQTLGVEPEVLVGICVERSLLMLVGLLGILKAGGAYVPLDPTYPTERLAYMLSDSQVSLLLTMRHLADSLPNTGAQIICLDTDVQVKGAQSQENPLTEVKPSNLAYIIYTSGSTGKPKGVTISHRSLVNFTSAAQVEYSIDERDRVLQFATISFDVAAEEIYPCLTSGGTLVLRTSEMLSSISTFVQHCREWKVTVLFMPAAYWHSLTSELATTDLMLPESLRLVVFGGEGALSEKLRLWQKCVNDKHLEPPQLFNVYGPTEATIVATIGKISDFVLSETRSLLPIGRPLGNVKAYILDRYLQSVPIGVPGELHIGGVGLARGYLNRPDLTAEKFIQNPFNESERLYKTGDYARYLLDGNIEFLGRMDNQVKIRGFRIELGEIETVLASHPQVRESVVVVTEDIPGSPRLVAYVVHNEASPILSKELRGFLKQQLPDYMIPSAFVMLAALPLTPNDKVDRRALPAPSLKNEGSFVPPCTPTQEVIAGIWSDVLSLELVSIHDNFFEFGGHSLLAFQVMSRLREAFAVDLPLRCLFEAPTVAELDQLLSQRRQSNLESIRPAICRRRQRFAIAPVPRNTQEVPISLNQLEFWVLAQLYPDIPLYNVPLVYRLNGVLNVTALEQASVEIVRRHEVLRTSFAIMDGQVVQKIIPEPGKPFAVMDLRDFSEFKTEREALAQQLITKEVEQPFDLTRSPLLRVKLLRLDEVEHLLVITTHHIINDGSSVGVFLQEFQVLYEAFCNNSSKANALSELPIQYADFALWQQQWLVGKALASHLDYWKQQIGNAPPVLLLPTDRKRSPVRTFQAANQSLLLPVSLTNALKVLSQKQNVTLFMTLLAAFKILLFHYSGQEDIVVMSPFTNRQQEETRKLVGCFMNTLPLRTYLSGNLTFLQLLERVRQVVLTAHDHQQVPFVKLVEALRPKQDPNNWLVLDRVLFNFMPPFPTLALSNLSVLPVSIASNMVDSDLEVHLQEQTSGSIECQWCYKTDLFLATTIERAIARFLAILESIVTHPDQRLADFGILFESDRVERPAINLECQSLTSKSNPQVSFIPPNTPTEKAIAAIWCDVLGLELVGIHDNFFELGGHSQLAIQVMYRLGTTFKVELSIRSLFEQPTIAGLIEIMNYEL